MIDVLRMLSDFILKDCYLLIVPGQHHEPDQESEVVFVSNIWKAVPPLLAVLHTLQGNAHYKRQYCCCTSMSWRLRGKLHMLAQIVGAQSSAKTDLRLVQWHDRITLVTKVFTG